MREKIVIPSGTRFGKLTVLPDKPESIQVGTKKHLYYHCQCDCGNDVWYRKSWLLSGKRKSCGCQAKTAGLSRIARLQKKPIATSTTGYTGVRLNRSGKYEAYYTLHGEFHHLGTFDSAEEAAKVRAEAVKDLK